MSEVVDLTMPLAHGMDAFPGEPTASFSPFSTIVDGGIEMWRVDVFSQLGTHVDAPSHFLPGGVTVDRLDLTACIGPAVVLDVGADGVIGAADLRPHEAAIRAAGRVLLRTGWSEHVGTPGYWSGSPELAIEAAHLLVGWGVRLLGLDTPTPSFSDLHEIHRILLGAGVLVAECLVHLDRLATDVTLICLPLPLVGLDGSPARIVALQGDRADGSDDCADRRAL